MADEPVQSKPRIRLTAPEMPGPVVLVLIVANLAMFAVEIASGVDPFRPQVDKVVELGANFAPKTLHGEPWRLFTSMFLHFGFLHLAMNMAFLYVFRVVERLYGSARFAALYLVSGLLGSIASLVHASNVASAGASGALFGVFGAFVPVLLFRKDQLDGDELQKMTRRLGGMFAINVIYGLSQPGIDMSAHIGGLIGGLAAGGAMLYGAKADAQRLPRTIAVAVGGLAIVGAALFAFSTRVDYTSLLFEFDKVQPAAIKTFNDLVEQRNSGKIGDAQMADAIEHDVLPPWQALRKKLDDATDVPEEVRVIYSKVTRFMQLREEGWLARIALLRDPSNLDMQAKAAARDADADAAVRDLNDTMEQMKAKSR